MSEDLPESPVERIEIEHADGTIRVLEGDDAHRWAQWVDSGLYFASTHGGQPPEVEWETIDDGE